MVLNRFPTCCKAWLAYATNNRLSQTPLWNSLRWRHLLVHKDDVLYLTRDCGNGDVPSVLTLPLQGIEKVSVWRFISSHIYRVGKILLEKMSVPKKGVSHLRHLWHIMSWERAAELLQRGGHAPGGVWGPVLKIGASSTSATRSYHTFMIYPQNMPYISEIGKTPYKLKSVLIFDAFLRGCNSAFVICG